MTPITEELRSICPYCGQDVVFLWRDGVVPSPDYVYVLVADWVYHGACWESQVAERLSDDPA